MSTFAELADEVALIGDPDNNNPIVVLQYLRRTENDFIERTQCTEKIVTIETDGDDYCFNVAAVSVLNNTFSIAGDHTDIFLADRSLTVADSTGNDGTYTISSSSYVAPNTVIVCVDTIEDSTADGTITLNPQATYALPTDYVKELRIEWDGVRIYPIATASPASIHQNDGVSEYTGTPQNYWMEEGEIRLLLKPSSHGIIKIWYVYSNTNSSSTSPVIPSAEQRKLINGAIAKMLEFNKEENRAIYYRKLYEDDIEETFWKYKNRHSKQTHVVDVNDVESGVITDEVRTYGFDSGFGS